MTSRGDNDGINQESAGTAGPPSESARQAEHELGRAADDVQSLINATDIGTVFLDRTGRIKLFTPRVRDIFSLTPADRGRPLEAIHGHLFNVDLHADIGRVLEQLERVEREVTTKDGRWYLMRIVPYRTADDRVDGVVLTFIDITERKQAAEHIRHSEERLRRALEVETVGVIFFDADYRITDTNDAFLGMSGYSRDDIRNGHLSWEVLTVPERQPQIICALEELRAKGRSVPHEVEYIRPDGTRWAGLLAATRQTDGDGVAFIIDVTDRQRANLALRDADRRKNEFLATLAHELRNPLAPIATSLHLLKMSDGGGPVATRARETIERQVAHMVRLAEDLVEVSRITLGKIEFRKQTLDLRTILRSALDGVTAAIDSGAHEVRVELPADALPVEGDPVRLTQVFVNVLNNSLKYTPDRGRIQVTATRTGDLARVSVRDTGIGITEQVLPHVFEMFTQGSDLPVGHPRSGLGVGLTLVRTLVEGHGGHVEARSEGPGKGTEVIVHLPLTTAAPETSAAESMLSIDLSGQSVLVVDDNRDAADSLGALLNLFGAEVEVVYSGHAGLSALASRHHVMAFVDIGMPLMDGFEVARQIRAGGSSMALVAVTGWGQEHDRNAALSAGFNYHLTKPADPVRLREVLGSIVSRQK